VPVFENKEAKTQAKPLETSRFQKLPSLVSGFESFEKPPVDRTKQLNPENRMWTGCTRSTFAPAQLPFLRIESLN
jgi:hypothetical protein